MGTDNAELNIVVRLRDEASQGLRQITNNTQRLQSQFRRASIFMAGASAVLGGALFATVRAGREQENILALLRGAIERTGESFEDNSERIFGAIGNLARITGLSESELLQGLLDAINLSGDLEFALNTLLPAAMDVAAARGMPLETALRNVNNAVHDGTGELLDYIPELETAETATERLALITERFGGAAKEARDPVSALTSLISDTLANTGTIDRINSLADSLDGFFRSIEGSEESSRLLRDLGDALLIAFGAAAVGAVVAGAIAIASPILLVAGAVAILSGGLFFLIRRWDEVVRFFTDNALARGLFNPFSDIILAINRFINEDLPRLRVAWDATWRFFSETVPRYSALIINRVVDMINGVLEALNRISFTIPDIPGLPGRGGTFGPNIPLIPDIPVRQSGARPNIPSENGLSVNVNFSQPVILDNEQTARALGSEISRQIRTVLRTQRGF